VVPQKIISQKETYGVINSRKVITGFPNTGKLTFGNAGRLLSRSTRCSGAQ
jgi:hypothetical protein